MMIKINNLIIMTFFIKIAHGCSPFYKRKEFGNQDLILS